ncbi:hypothetical protein RN001_016324 [Aquatica leii]|uniref:Uncharacterized protein n=1 Tax=Aquatica leii TaxID=1421715 RepID=A0AAN7NUA2_9COLE|nr:hypothetical protein RN001_016324 [Aquatica leii]
MSRRALSHAELLQELEDLPQYESDCELPSNNNSTDEDADFVIDVREYQKSSNDSDETTSPLSTLTRRNSIIDIANPVLLDLDLGTDEVGETNNDHQEILLEFVEIDSIEASDTEKELLDNDLDLKDKFMAASATDVNMNSHLGVVAGPSHENPRERTAVADVDQANFRKVTPPPNTSQKSLRKVTSEPEPTQVKPHTVITPAMLRPYPKFSGASKSASEVKARKVSNILLERTMVATDIPEKNEIEAYKMGKTAKMTLKRNLKATEDMEVMESEEEDPEEFSVYDNDSSVGDEHFTSDEEDNLDVTLVQLNLMISSW